MVQMVEELLILVEEILYLQIVWIYGLLGHKIRNTPQSQHLCLCFKVIKDHSS
jgi:hypothetical protein